MSRTMHNVAEVCLIFLPPFFCLYPRLRQNNGRVSARAVL